MKLRTTSTSLGSFFLVVLASTTLLNTSNAFVITKKSHHASSYGSNTLHFVNAATTTTVESKANVNNEIANDRNDDMRLWMEQLAKQCVMIATIITIGCTLVSQVPSVSAVTIDQYQMKDTSTDSTFLLLAKGAYVPEAGYDTLDFSMPTYRVEDVETTAININDVLGGTTSDDRSSSTAGANKKVGSSSSSSSPNRAEKGALAVAQAKAKKEAVKAEALAKQKALKEKAVATSSSTGTTEVSE